MDKQEYPLKTPITLAQAGFTDLVIRQIEPGVWQMKTGLNSDGNARWNTINGITHQQVIDQIRLYRKPEKEETAMKTKYGFSAYHDQVLDLCRAKYGPCPFGCVKDGAPNCFSNVSNLDCPPSRAITFTEKEEKNDERKVS